MAVPRVVAVPFSMSQGHVNPLMHFCFSLADRGVHITVVGMTIQGISPSLIPSIKIPEIPHEYTGRIHTESLLFDLSHLNTNNKHGLADILAQVLQEVEDLSGPLEELLHRLQNRFHVCCILSDCMNRWTYDVAKRLGIPRVSFWTAALASLAVDFHVPLLMTKESIPVTEANKDNIVDCIPGLAPMRAGDLPVMYHEKNMMTFTDPGYRRKIARCTILVEDAWIIANSFEELEPSVFKALRQVLNKNIIGVGPLLPPEVLTLSEDHVVARPQLVPSEIDCIKWLDGKPENSVLYISFGSIVPLTSSEFDELSGGIESSKQSFLWALRKESVEEVSEDVLEAFKDRTSGEGLVISWSPQVEVLSHAATGAFLTHCGWNSVLEGIICGVPMLGWPIQAEQNLNCHVLEDRKVGVRLNCESAENVGRRADEIACKVESVMKDHEMREKAKQLKLSAKTSLQECAPSHLDAFVSYLTNLS